MTVPPAKESALATSEGRQSARRAGSDTPASGPARSPEAVPARELVRPRMLLVARGFPPSSDPTSYRWLRFAVGLLERGWDVEVLTAQYVPRLDYYDPGLVRRIPPAIKVHRAWPGPYDPRVARARLEGATGAGSNRNGTETDRKSVAGPAAALRRGLRTLDERLAPFKIPDPTFEWIAPGILLGARLLAARRLDLIVSSGAPFSSHVVAHGLARWARVPWIADFSDPYAENPFNQRPEWRVAVDRRIEAGWFRALSGVIVPVMEMKRLFLTQHPNIAPERVHVVPYGFDETMYANSEPASFDGFTIVHTGVFYPQMRDPNPFLEALAQTRDLPLRVVHAGLLQPEYRARLAALRIEDRFDIRGMLPREAVAPLQLGASCLLLIGNKGGLQLPGKLLDYLGAQRPILALRNEAHDIAANLVESRGAGKVVPNEPEAIAAALRELHAGWREGSLAGAYRHDGATEFSWSHIENDLDDRLRDHLRRGPRGVGHTRIVTAPDGHMGAGVPPAAPRVVACGSGHHRPVFGAVHPRSHSREEHGAERQMPGMKGAPSAGDARRIARHLIGEDPTTAETERWLEAVQVHGVTLESPRDFRLWMTAMRHPWLLGPTDAGLAFVDPHSPLRHRILLMLAILEASPHHCHRFLAAPWPRIALLGLVVRGLWAGLRVAAGIAWVRAHGMIRR